MQATNQAISIIKPQERVFSLLDFSILMIYKDQNSCILDSTSLYLILCKHNLYATEGKCSEKRRECILLQKL